MNEQTIYYFAKIDSFIILQSITVLVRYIITGLSIKTGKSYFWKPELHDWTLSTANLNLRNADFKSLLDA